MPARRTDSCVIEGASSRRRPVAEPLMSVHERYSADGWCCHKQIGTGRRRRVASRLIVRDATFLPCPELVAILEPAFQPCRQFQGACADVARWDLDAGYAPRGFVGAFGTCDDIDLVLVVAEPANPLTGERYTTEGAPRTLMAQAAATAFEHLEQAGSVIHRNMRSILDSCWPGTPLRNQLEHAWITQSHLCSASRPGASVPARSANACARDYLAPQLRLLHNRAIVACGSKAQERMRRMGIAFLPVRAPGKPGGNQRASRESWQAIPGYVERYRRR
jgi:hypothetical protein